MLGSRLGPGSDEDGGGAGPVVVSWDPANKGSAITLSGGNLIAATLDIGGIGTTVSHNSGKYVIRCLFVFIPGSDAAQRIGIASAAWIDSDHGPGFSADSYGLTASGFKINNNTTEDISRPFASGEYGIAWVNFNTGKIWFGTSVGGPSGDPESETGEAYNFTPNTAMQAAGEICSDNGIFIAIGTLDPTYTSGTFNAWGG